jgi:hypothetical protein
MSVRPSGRFPASRNCIRTSPPCGRCKWPSMAELFIRTGTRCISSWPGDLLQTKAGYIDSDFSHPPTFPLQSDGGPYIAPEPLIVSRS